jgi:hypothetical protein
VPDGVRGTATGGPAQENLPPQRRSDAPPE